MTRICTLVRFFLCDLFRSLTTLVPLAAALAFGLLAFEYGMDQARFITVAGLGIGVIGWLTTLLLAGRADHAWSFLLVARLRRRSELLAALFISGLGLTGVLALLITVPNLLAGRLTLELSSAGWIVPTWLVLWSLAVALALALSSLVSRGGSHLLGYGLLTALLVANDQKTLLTGHRLEGVVRVVDLLLWPVTRLLAQASAGRHDRQYFLALALTGVYAALLFALAVRLFADKDLLWPER